MPFYCQISRHASLPVHLPAARNLIGHLLGPLCNQRPWYNVTNLPPVVAPDAKLA